MSCIQLCMYNKNRNVYECIKCVCVYVYIYVCIYIYTFVFVLAVGKLKFHIISLGDLEPEAKARECSPSPEVFVAVTTQKPQCALPLGSPG